MNSPKLKLEILGGPLDGHVVTLEAETDWSRVGAGALSFPWDEELGAPQARFSSVDGHWWLQAHDALHGTYCLNRGERGERVEGMVALQEGDLLKASDTLLWCLFK